MATAAIGNNDEKSLIAASNVDGSTPVRLYADPTTHRLLVDLASTPTVYNDTVSGTINGSNTAFTVPNTIAANGAINLFLGGVPYQATIDYTYSGLNITMLVAPDASLSGQPFWLAHL